MEARAVPPGTDGDRRGRRGALGGAADRTARFKGVDPDSPERIATAALDVGRALADPAIMRILRPQTLVVLGVATGLSILSSALSYSFAMSRAKSNVLALAVYLNTTYWFAWALLAPAIIHLARRFRFDRLTWRRALAVHVPALLAACFAHIALSVGARVWRRLRARGLDVLDDGARHLPDAGGLGDDDLLRDRRRHVHAVDYQRAALERQVHAARLETSLARGATAGAAAPAAPALSLQHAARHLGADAPRRRRRRPHDRAARRPAACVARTSARRKSR